MSQHPLSSPFQYGAHYQTAYAYALPLKQAKKGRKKKLTKNYFDAEIVIRAALGMIVIH